MVIKTAKDVGLALRERRRHLRISQAELARRIGATRYWVIDMERGKDSAELGLVLRAARALGLTLDLGTGAESATPARTGKVDIDAIVTRAKRERGWAGN